MKLNEQIRETEKDWDRELAQDVKGECESKYGKVLAIKVEKDLANLSNHLVNEEGKVSTS